AAAPGERQPQDRFGHRVQGDQFLGKTPEGRWRPGQGEFQKSSATLESRQVFFPPQGPAVADPQGFKQSVAIQETAIGYGHDRLRLGEKSAIEENMHSVKFANATFAGAGRLPRRWRGC